MATIRKPPETIRIKVSLELIRLILVKNYTLIEPPTVRQFIDIPSTIFRGLYQNSWPSEFNCTSNCTWDKYYLTLGFSSTCANVTEETIGTVKCKRRQAGNKRDHEWEENCNMNAPRGVQFNFSPEMDIIMSINSSSWNASVLNSSFLNAAELFHAAVWTWDQEGDFLREKGGWEEGGLRTNLQKSMVIECALGIALYNYSNISSISNNFNIGVTEKILLGKSTGSTTEHYSNDTMPQTDFFEITFWWNNTGRGLPESYVSMTDLAYLNAFIHSTAFSGTIRKYQNASDPLSPGATVSFGNGSLEVVSSKFDNIALSLTDLIRQSSTKQLAQGLTSQAVVYIRVRWRWLILPLAVHFLGGIALVGTVIGRQQTRDVPLWKGSALAVLYHSVDKDGVLAARVKDLEELEKVKPIQVMLEKKSAIFDS